jgi:hypothetical protein
MEIFSLFTNFTNPTTYTPANLPSVFSMDQSGDDLVPTTCVVVHNSGLEMCFDIWFSTDIRLDGWIFYPSRLEFVVSRMLNSRM